MCCRRQGIDKRSWTGCRVSVPCFFLLLPLIGTTCFSNFPWQLSFFFLSSLLNYVYRIYSKAHVALLGSPSAEVIVTVSRGGRTTKFGQQNSLPRPDAMAVAAAETAAAAAAAVLPSCVFSSMASLGKLNGKPVKPSDRPSGVGRPAGESFLVPLWLTVISGRALLILEWGANEEIGGVEGVLGLFIPAPSDFFPPRALVANRTIQANKELDKKEEKKKTSKH